MYVSTTEALLPLFKGPEIWEPESSSSVPACGSSESFVIPQELEDWLLLQAYSHQKCAEYNDGTVRKSEQIKHMQIWW